MGPISMLFPNPAVKILEERLWEDARKCYWPTILLIQTTTLEP